MAVRQAPSGEVHNGSKGGRTAYRVDTNDQSTHWTNTNERVTCPKNGCR